MTLKERIALDRALSSTAIALRFVGFALAQIPEDKTIRAMLLDARDQLAIAADALEAEAK